MIVQEILKLIRDDYKNYNDQEWKQRGTTDQERLDLRREAYKTDDWDEEKLRLRLYEADHEETTYYIGNHRIIQIREKQTVATVNHLWIRAIRLLSGQTPVKVLWFASPKKRVPPPVGKKIEPKHINGGYTQRCHADKIVIYREEEALRVLIHELLHASCSDPSEYTIAELEADTEAWAEIILIALIAKGDPALFIELWKRHVKHVKEQIVAAKNYYATTKQTDYGWRYLIGRVAIFKEHDLWIADRLPTAVRVPTTLRLTLEHKN